MTKQPFDAFERRYIFCMWPGTDKISEDRITELYSIFSNTHCPVVFLNGESYKKWELPEHPFQPGFAYLSETHRSDYLRIYLLHHFGGGYTDIKFTYKQWDTAFETLKNSDAYGLGYALQSTNAVGMSPRHDNSPELALYKAHYSELIGHVALICKQGTPFTSDLLSRMHLLMDEKFQLLMENPSRDKKDSFGKVLADGSVSAYPFNYVELGPDQFIRSTFRFKNQLLKGDIEPLHVWHFDLDVPGFREGKKQMLQAHLPSHPAA